MNLSRNRRTLKKTLLCYARVTLFTAAGFGGVLFSYLILFTRAVPGSPSAALKCVEAVSIALVLLGIVLESLTNLFLDFRTLEEYSGRPRRLVHCVERIGAWTLIIGVAFELVANAISESNLPASVPSAVCWVFVPFWLVLLGLLCRAMRQALR